MGENPFRRFLQRRRFPEVRIHLRADQAEEGTLKSASPQVRNLQVHSIDKL